MKCRVILNLTFEMAAQREMNRGNPGAELNLSGMVCEKKRESSLPLFSRFAVLAGLTCFSLVVLLAVSGHTRSVPARIVSLSPNVTEILFALGVGDRVTGISRYCDYPPGAVGLPRVGGLVDPDYEAIISLQPDLVILLTSHDSAARALRKLGISTLKVPHRTIDDVHQSILRIGRVCGVSERAGSLVSALKRRTRAVSFAVAGRPRPRVLLCIGRSTSSSHLGAIYVAGRDGFFSRIIDLAGGGNACVEGRAAFPRISAEGVIRLNPEVIVDLVNMRGDAALPEAELEKQWQSLAGVSAVLNKRVHVWTDTQGLRPGPRYAEFLYRLASLLHPEADIPKPMP
ncbi:MAG TPA: ABC transporter substrate-binding protein [Candidatus Aminicenantes bacterium]|nr:ABC transporter substrate-binding protein [Candidatus Aminicenantes bacterium]